VTARTGWLPHHLLLELDGELAACAPAYLKSHSQGEYVFDYGWADAYEGAGGDVLSQAAERGAVHAGAGSAPAGPDGPDRDARNHAYLASRRR
jgi:hypothetical protein